MKKLFLCILLVVCLLPNIFASDVTFFGVVDGTTKKDAVKILKQQKVKTTEVGSMLKVNLKEYLGLKTISIGLNFTKDKEPKMKGYAISFDEDNTLEDISLAILPILEEYGIDFLKEPIVTSNETYLVSGKSEDGDVIVQFYYESYKGHIFYDLLVLKTTY